MIIICSEEEKKEILKQCDNRCAEEKWCPFGRFMECPIDNGQIQTVEKIGINTIFHDATLK